MAKKTKPPKDLSVLLDFSTGTLAQIASKTNSLTILANIVQQICPDLPSDTWHIANFRANILVIEVKSSVWSQRLQFERNNICQALSLETNNQFNQIEIKIAPYRTTTATFKEAPKTPTSHVPRYIPKAASQHLLEIAQSAPAGLKEKLERLAKLTK